MNKTMRIISFCVIIFVAAAVPLGIKFLSDSPGSQKGGSMQITSSAFVADQPMPSMHAYHNENINPPLEFQGVPIRAKSLALIVHDPDAPSGDFTHWLMWNIPVTTTRIIEGPTPTGAVQGTNDFGNARWDGPSPPSGTHHYHFMVYALDTTLDIPATSKRADVERAMKGHILEQAELVGLYSGNQ